MSLASIQQLSTSLGVRDKALSSIISLSGRMLLAVMAREG